MAPLRQLSQGLNTESCSLTTTLTTPLWNPSRRRAMHLKHLWSLLLAESENQLGEKLKMLRDNKGGEYIRKKWDKY
jgi:hypothetical protein